VPTLVENDESPRGGSCERRLLLDPATGRVQSTIHPEDDFTWLLNDGRLDPFRRVAQDEDLGSRTSAPRVDTRRVAPRRH